MKRFMSSYLSYLTVCSEHVFQTDLAGDLVSVVVGLQAVGGDHGGEDCLLRARASLEDALLALKFQKIPLANSELVLREFHLAQVDALIGSIDQQVDFPTRRRP